MEEFNDVDNSGCFSRKVKAGKRTYFFDVKSTRSNDFYITITESKKRFRGDRYMFEKHKIFLYKEDFLSFLNALEQTINHVKYQLLPEYDFEARKKERIEHEEFPELMETSDSEDLKWD
ncbi:MAG: PUR family DNA/RNA-binding protein [Cytophagaceae bacterium]|nr:PUR family DNA/RNA-binding protein [Cytophagaceae bacterium]MDW8457218.1 DUF3276 family protein [Cytophagaceae bacterium]